MYVSSLPILFTSEKISLWSVNGINMRLKMGVGFLILRETKQKSVTVQSENHSSRLLWIWISTKLSVTTSLLVAAQPWILWTALWSCLPSQPGYQPCPRHGLVEQKRPHSQTSGTCEGRSYLCEAERVCRSNFNRTW